ncbi:protein PTCD3 homolog, mitochondrial isoform X2 [Cephus cinctus]|uniref:Small ribosomal subunit protein mS39 n=1 Tax=Cephus cinctus TaxID=211228 RepID=A0AAJ7BQW0_CEPCN|nr:protein PTCD3 homolog, mitochondrial isoform X2 [Cephus cinctus]
MNSLRGGFSSRCTARSLMMRLQSSLTTSTTSSQLTEEIQIPNRIERGPTDILKALESTISRDPTAPHYKYHDDPYFIPQSNITKRTYALAQEAGRKAALWIREEHRDVFQHKLADPPIESFMPKPVYTDKSQVSENTLLNVIKHGQVTEAINIYKLLQGEVSTTSKQALFELLCYTNSKDPINKDFIEERWFRQVSSEVKNTWKNCLEAEELFTFLKNQDEATAAAAYNTLLRGLAKFLQTDKAWELYQECQNKKVPLNAETYNYIIQTVQFLKDGSLEKKQLLQTILMDMAAQGVQPNIGTLNASLKVVSSLSQNFAKDLARSLITEFTTIGIEPSLASYYYVLRIFCQEKGPTNNVLSEIIQELEGKELKVQDPMDTFFFMTAMDVAKNHLHDAVVAERLHGLLLAKDNYKFIGDSYKESVYFRHYMSILVETEPLEDFMKIYHTLVPNIYIPEPSVMASILYAVEGNPPEIGRELLPQFFSHMVMFDQLERRNLVTHILELMRVHCRPPPNSPLHAQYAESAWALWNFIQNQRENKLRKLQWTGDMLGNVAVLSLRGDQFDRMLQAISFLTKDQTSVIGTPNIEQIDELCNACIEQGHIAGALAIIQYAAELGHQEASLMARKVYNTLPLTPSQEDKLVSLVGKEVLKIQLSVNKE